MSEMIERVAQAICGDDNPDNVLTIHRLNARKAMEAMREPTQAMIAAAMAPYLYGNDEKMNAAFRSTIKEYWRAMIDEGLR